MDPSLRLESLSTSVLGIIRVLKISATQEEKKKMMNEMNDALLTILPIARDTLKLYAASSPHHQTLSHISNTESIFRVSLQCRVDVVD